MILLKSICIIYIMENRYDLGLTHSVFMFNSFSIKILVLSQNMFIDSYNVLFHFFGWGKVSWLVHFLE